MFLEYVQPFNFSVEVDDTAGLYTLTFLVPPTDRTGYTEFSVETSTGGVARLNRVLYYGEKCAESGMYGEGLSCRHCPDGGHCPGGNRSVLLWIREVSSRVGVLIVRL